MTGNETALQILDLYHGRDEQAWDLHAFFEFFAGDARGNREAVFDLVDRLVERGYLESRGSDFYTITEKGKAAAASGRVDL